MLYLIISIFLLSNCTENRDNCSYDAKNQQSNFIDTLRIINEIKKQFAEINSSVFSYDKVEKDVFGESTEGAVVIGYYKTNELKKTLAIYYGETGKAEFEYYYNKEGVFFLYKKESFYDKPIYVEDPKIKSTMENRYYFYKGELIQWLKKDKKAINPNSKEFQEEKTFLKKDIEKMNKTVQRSLPTIKNKTVQGDTIRCRLGSRCPDTGYIIKGSRDSTGRVIHIKKPRSRNVPIEE